MHSQPSGDEPEPRWFLRHWGTGVYAKTLGQLGFRIVVTIVLFAVMGWLFFGIRYLTG